MWDLLHARPDRQTVSRIVKQVARADREWLGRLDAIWKKGRTGPMATGHLWSFPAAAVYSQTLAEDDEELRELLHGHELKCGDEC